MVSIECDSEIEYNLKAVTSSPMAGKVMVVVVVYYSAAAPPGQENDCDGGNVLYEFSGVQPTRCAGANQV